MLHKKIADQWLRKQAGHFIETVQGTGWTENEAFNDATSENVTGFADETISDVLKTRMVKKPRPAKRVKVVKSTVTKGPVKKAYTIDLAWSHGAASNPIYRDRDFSRQYKTQSEVLKAAKYLAIKYQVQLVIELKAFCVGDTKLATLTPEKGEPGVWEFEIDFHS